MFARIANTDFRIRLFRFMLTAIALACTWATFASAQAISNFGDSRLISYSQPAATLVHARSSQQSTASFDKLDGRATGLYNDHCAQCHGVDGRGVVTPAPRGPLTWRESLAFAKHLRNFSKQKASQSPPTCPANIQTSAYPQAYFAPIQSPPVVLQPMQPMRPMQQTLVTAPQLAPFPMHPPVSEPSKSPAQSTPRPRPPIEIVAPIPEPQAELPEPQPKRQPQADLPIPERDPQPIPEDLTPEELEEELDRQLIGPKGGPSRHELPKSGAMQPTRFPILVSPLRAIPPATQDRVTSAENHRERGTAQANPSVPRSIVYPRTETPDMELTRWPQTATPHADFYSE